MTHETQAGITENPPRMLFVDDEATIRTLLSAIFKRRGFDVTVAATVSEALTLIASQTFDVLLSDLNIGEAGDGFTVVSAMRRTHPETATFILTGYPAFESALQAIRQQVDDYFIKPADVDGLVLRIQAALTDPKTSRHRIEPVRLARILEDQRREILAAWLRAAHADEQIHSTRLSDEELADHLPTLIDEIFATPEDRKLTSKAFHAAQQHGRARYRQGCGVPAMLREARILHDVISRIVQENLLGVEISYLITDIMAVGEIIQAFLEESIRSFLLARHAVTPHKNASILLLGDDRELSLLRLHALQQAGFSVVCAHSRPEALGLLESSFDALVISCSLPGDSIREFTQFFRERNPHAPIIGVVKGDRPTLHVDLEFIVNGDNGPEALLEIVEAALNRTQLHTGQ